MYREQRIGETFKWTHYHALLRVKYSAEKCSYLTNMVEEGPSVFIHIIFSSAYCPLSTGRNISTTCRCIQMADNLPGRPHQEPTTGHPSRFAQCHIENRLNAPGRKGLMHYWMYWKAQKISLITLATTREEVSPWFTTQFHRINEILIWSTAMHQSFWITEFQICFLRIL